MCSAQELKTITLGLRPDRTSECLVLRDNDWQLRCSIPFWVVEDAVSLSPGEPSGSRTGSIAPHS